MTLFACALLAGDSLIDLDGTIFVQLAVFFVAFLVLRAFVFKPMLALFEAREQAIDGTRQEARRLEREAEDKAKRFDEALRRVRQEAGEERDRLQKDGERLERTLLEKVRKETQATLADAETRMADESARTKRDLDTTVPALARQNRGAAARARGGGVRAALAGFGLVAVLALTGPALAQEDTDAEPAAAHEGESSEHGGAVSLDTVFESTEFWGAIVNFALLVILIVVFGRKPLQSFLETRKRSVEEGLAEAARLKDAAEKTYAEYTRRLERLDDELAKLRAEMVKAGEAERDRIIASAESKAARLRKETEFLVEQQMKQLRTDLAHAAVQAAVTAAADVLRDQTTTADQERLATAYVERLRERFKDPPDAQGGGAR